MEGRLHRCSRSDVWSDLRATGEGYRLDLKHVGGEHAADSVVVTVPDEKIMFLGDSYYPPPLRLGLADRSPNIEMLKSFLSEACELYLDGHGTPFTKTELAAGLSEN